MKTSIRIITVTLFALVGDMRAHWDDLMTSKTLYKGVSVELSLREGLTKHTQAEIEAAQQATRYIEGFLDALDLRGNSRSSQHRMVDGIKAYLDEHPEKQKIASRLVVLEVIQRLKLKPNASKESRGPSSKSK